MRGKGEKEGRMKRTRRSVIVAMIGLREKRAGSQAEKIDRASAPRTATGCACGTSLRQGTWNRAGTGEHPRGERKSKGKVEQKEEKPTIFQGSARKRSLTEQRQLAKSRPRYWPGKTRNKSHFNDPDAVNL